MTLEIKKPNKLTEIQEIERLAKEIWNEHFSPIIGKEQVDYMLEKFQSTQAITKQLESNCDYYLATQNKTSVAYIALIKNEAMDKMMLSKIYLKKSHRGSGLGNKLLEFAKNKAIETKVKKICLSVNRDNTDTINWYKRKGFKITDEVKKDIGSGFYMDDFIMELEV